MNVADTEKELVTQKLKQEYEGLKQAWLAMTPEQLIQNAGKIAMINDIYSGFKGSDKETNQYILNQENALEVVAEYMLGMKAAEGDVEILHSIWDLTEDDLQQKGESIFGKGVTMW